MLPASHRTACKVQQGNGAGVQLDTLFNRSMCPITELFCEWDALRSAPNARCSNSDVCASWMTLCAAVADAVHQGACMLHAAQALWRTALVHLPPWPKRLQHTPPEWLAFALALQVHQLPPLPHPHKACALLV